MEALIRVIHAHPELSCLDLSGTPVYLEWGPLLQSIFEALEKHPSLRTQVAQDYELDDEEDEGNAFVCRYNFYPSWLKQWLSRNRNIAVLDNSGNKCTDGSTIDKAYALNEFYNGSLALVNESASLRTLLVATALTRSASINFQFTALLLSQYADTLCEFVHGLDFEDAAMVGFIPQEDHPDRTAKRYNRVQPSYFAKKAFRDEV